jgi:hypothetical protein
MFGADGNRIDLKEEARRFLVWTDWMVGSHAIPVMASGGRRHSLDKSVAGNLATLYKVWPFGTACDAQRLSLSSALWMMLTVLGGCISRPAEPVGVDPLAGTCQLRPCQCIRSDLPVWSLGDPQPVRWRETGDAACPDGYRLQVRK